MKWKYYYSILGLSGIMENEMETTIVYWGYIRIMENGKYHSAQEIYRYNGKQHGNYYIGSLKGFQVHRVSKPQCPK